MMYAPAQSGGLDFALSFLPVEQKQFGDPVDLVRGQTFKFEAVCEIGKGLDVVDDAGLESTNRRWPQRGRHSPEYSLNPSPSKCVITSVAKHLSGHHVVAGLGHLDGLFGVQAAEKWSGSPGQQ